MEVIMNKETKETTPKERIVVLEKGKAMDIDLLGICCLAALVPFRAW